ncbi:MAG: carbohydrate ABC transporter permease [Eubacterium sp.]
MLEKKEAGLVTAVELKKPHIAIIYWLFFAMLIVVSCITLLPIVWVAISGFKDVQEFYAVPPVLLPKSFDFGKVKEVWQVMDYGRYYLNTIKMTVGNLVFCIMCTGLAGYVLSRLKPKGSKVVFRLIMWSLMMPACIVMVPLFQMFVDFPYFHWNFSNTYVPMWLIAGSNVFYTLMFKNNFDAIPISYIESARLDGCSSFGIFMKIIIPLSVPVIMVVAIFTINASWSDFLYPYLLIKDQDIYPISVKLFSAVKSTFRIDQQILAVFLAIIPPVILFCFLQKYIMAGFTMSGIKE